MLVAIADNAGNVGKAGTSFTTTTSVAPPTIELDAPVEGAVFASSQVEFRGQASDSNGLAGVKVDGSDLTLNGESFAGTVEFAEGFHTVQLAATDSVGQSAYFPVSFEVDLTAPVLRIDEPFASGEVNQATMLVKGEASDTGSGLEEIRIDGTLVSHEQGSFEVEVLLALGLNTIRVEAVDRAGHITSQEVQVERLDPPKISITEPASGSLSTATTVDVRGKLSRPGLEVTVSGVPATVVGTEFLATDVALSEGLSLITAVAEDPTSGLRSAASVVVGKDRQAPRVEILSPPAGARVEGSFVEVLGLVNDLVAGTVNAGQCTVTVNGVTATVRNRTFRALVPLVPGENVVEAIATDVSGNSSAARLRVVRGPAEMDHLVAVAGDRQSAPISSTLPEPLVVEARDLAGNPVPGVALTFEVRDTNGFLDGGARRLEKISGPDGRAAVTLTLGSHAGLGNQRVEVTAPGYQPLRFHADAETGPPAHIFVDSGDQQVDVAGQRLAMPLIAAITDSGFNRLSEVPVVFEVVEGGGTLENGLALQAVSSDGSGKAMIFWTLGGSDGIANNALEVRLVDQPDLYATFQASGMAVGRPEDTVLEGLVLDNAELPIAGVGISLHGALLHAVTDESGYFRLEAVPPGVAMLEVHGQSADRPGVWPSLEFMPMVVAGRVNHVGRPIYLLPIDVPRGLAVTETSGGILTLPEVPGLALEVAPGSVTFPGGSREGVISITSVNTDKVPMTPGFAQQPRFILTIQPAGAHFDPPARLTLPNTDGLQPGEVTEMYSFDHDLGMFVSIGPATTSEDGTVIRADQGIGIIKAGWHCGGNPNTSGTPHDCPECKICSRGRCVVGCALREPGNPASFALPMESTLGRAACGCKQDDPCAIKSCNGSGACVKAEDREIGEIKVFAAYKDPLQQVFNGPTAIEYQALVKPKNCTALKVDFVIDTGQGRIVQPGEKFASIPEEGLEIYVTSYTHTVPGRLVTSAKATCGSCPKTKNDSVNVELFEIEIDMKVESIEISQDGKYTEDALVKAKAIRKDTGEIWDGLNEKLDITEVCPSSMRCIYSQNQSLGANLPQKMQFNSGLANFTAKSLAGPERDGSQHVKPSDAEIRTVKYPTRNGRLLVAQWVDQRRYDLLSRGPVFDWFEKRAVEVFEPVEPMFQYMASYTVKFMENDYGLTSVGVGPLSTVNFSPHSDAIRTNTFESGPCGFSSQGLHKGLMAHEGRHCYQSWLACCSSVGHDDDPARSPDNDEDADYLVDVVTVAPFEYLRDTSEERPVCNQESTKIEIRAFSGDLVFDSHEDNVLWAMEGDAHHYESEHSRINEGKDP